jgi:hypothetical protein
MTLLFELLLFSRLPFFLTSNVRIVLIDRSLRQPDTRFLPFLVLSWEAALSF